MIGFREMCGQSLVKVGKIRSNLINGPDTVGDFEGILVILEVWGIWVILDVSREFWPF